MVEYTLQLDSIFSSLADSTRRDILHRVSGHELSISEIAEPYNLTFAAVSKHLMVLEKANLVRKRRHGKEQLVHAVPETLVSAEEYLRQYQRLWEDRLTALGNYLKEEESHDRE